MYMYGRVISMHIYGFELASIYDTILAPSMNMIKPFLTFTFLLWLKKFEMAGVRDSR